STDLKKWVAVSCLSLLPLAMIVPFLQVFAHQVKGANQYVLGTMTIAMIIVRLLFGIPLGKLADRIGRKKIIYLLAPLWYASSLLLVFSLNSITLVLAGGLFGFYFISSVVTDSMTLELVPIEQMGRWSGLLGLFGGLVTIPAPLLSGLIWKNISPIYIFLIPVAVDLFLKIPLLTTVPETLHRER
ncbi:MFS transporter, partial [Patescibacteria group bacterium]|nr:MFS transporter [Patescibacteria group bacterium]